LEKREATKMTNLKWQEQYKAALLELRPEALQPRIEAAEAAIHQRLQELKDGGDGSSDERNKIADALRGLRTLAKTECRPQSGFASDAPAPEMAS
jgi:hypothetical protein